MSGVEFVKDNRKTQVHNSTANLGHPTRVVGVVMIGAK
jgi:hypothetical protein